MKTGDLFIVQRYMLEQMQDVGVVATTTACGNGNQQTYILVEFDELLVYVATRPHAVYGLSFMFLRQKTSSFVFLDGEHCSVYLKHLET